MKKVIYVELSKEEEDGVIELIDKTIKSVFNKRENVSFTQKEAKLLRAKTLDQLSVHMASRAKMRTSWGFGSGVGVPILIDFIGATEAQANNLMSNNSSSKNKYVQLDDLSWQVMTKCDGASYQDFKNKVLADLKEDAVTAAFYSALSHTSVW